MINIGDTVVVGVQTMQDPASKLNGNAFVVKSRKRLHRIGYEFTLYGATAETGLPYFFAEHSLRKVLI